MVPFKLQTKYFTLEIFRRGIVFTIASFIFASGINLINGNIIIAVISIFNKQILKVDSNEFGFIIGIFLLLLSLFLFYLIIINWRIEIYSKVFIQIRKTADKYVEAMNNRVSLSKSSELKSLHKEGYAEYRNTVQFLGENQTNLDVETYTLAWELNKKIGEKYSDFDCFIKEAEKIENNIHTSYNLDTSNIGINKEVDEIVQLHKDFVNIIKEKEKFKIQTMR